MDHKAVRAWTLYDWANSAFSTTMTAAVLPVFYADVAAATLDEHVATSYWGLTQTLAMIIIALMAPILGAIADYSGTKVRLLGTFAFVGICASAGFVFVGEGDYVLASALFVLALIGHSTAETFYDGLLGDLVPDAEREQVSARGFAYGYAGGGLLLVLNLLWIQKPEWFGIPDTLTGTRLSFISVAIWWFLFMLPLLRRVKDAKQGGRHTFGQYAKIGFGRVSATFRRIKRYPELLKFLAAFWFFNDGIATIITMATIYGREIGIGTADLIAALVITQFVGFPFTLLFGRIASRWGGKPALYGSLWIYVVIVVLGYFMQSAIHFYILAAMVGMVQGGSQSVARAMYSRLTPPDRRAEFFGFLNLSSRFSSIAGPAVFAVVGLVTGSSRWGILALILFFLVGIALLRKVDLDQGKADALQSH